MLESDETTIVHHCKEIIHSKYQFKKAIQASENRVRLDLETQDNEVVYLEKEYSELKR